jgi:hypothetical protein
MGHIRTRAPQQNVSAAVDRLVRLGTAYLAFTGVHTLRWRALFERRPPEGTFCPTNTLGSRDSCSAMSRSR